MNKMIKGYLIGKSIEIVVATAIVVCTGLTAEIAKTKKEDFIALNRKKSQRKRYSR
ncbi:MULTISPECIES: DUF3042 family protein [unclassified Lactococcus]|nr:MULTISPECIES: DUF3042 family protein [unclassified Lactococcus]MQW22409.1 DUF3042 family protein [Lactococcus sp. dk101]TXK45681.1 DUF3042 family protein [Lactococcus sp. dk310]TXK51854.1 DUF3042 family protein [Lactococcus sp. dk322]